jgi:hypothetical protein
MASPNSAKKAARLASRTGGSASSKKQANWLFPVAIVVLLAAGVGVIAYARDTRAREDPSSSGNTTHPIAQISQDQEVYDHWHAAFAIEVCGEQLPAVTDAKSTDLLGIHTHGDGLIHIHPFSLQSAGRRATLGKFFDQVGIKVSGDTIRLPTAYNGGDTFESGVTTCGGKKAEWVVAHWKKATEAADKAKPDQIFTKDFASVRLSEDLGAYTLAFVPVGETDDVLPPSSSADIVSLGQADAGTSSTATSEVVTETTAATATTTATTAASDASSTTEAGK